MLSRTEQATYLPPDFITGKRIFSVWPLMCSVCRIFTKKTVQHMLYFLNIRRFAGHNRLSSFFWCASNRPIVPRCVDQARGLDDANELERLETIEGRRFHRHGRGVLHGARDLLGTCSFCWCALHAALHLVSIMGLHLFLSLLYSQHDLKT